ncbi:MAG: hypothetical protein ABSB22_11750 [Thermodesulfobacteriota bacterium]
MISDIYHFIPIFVNLHRCGNRCDRIQTFDCPSLVFRCWMGVSHGHFDVLVTQQLGNRFDVVPLHTEPSPERMSKGMKGQLLDPCPFQSAMPCGLNIAVWLSTI